MRTCTVDGCSSAHYGIGFCNKHYQQFKRKGKIYNTNQEFNAVIEKKNHIELVLTNIKMEEIGRAKIDKEDLDKVKAIGRWTLQNNYVYNRAKGIMMHRVIMDAQEEEFVDHIKTGLKYKSDNRKKNLRIATPEENRRNVGIRKNNTSGYKGVSKCGEKWMAQITFNKTNIYLGLFNTPEKAFKAYCKAAKSMHKEFHNLGKT